MSSPAPVLNPHKPSAEDLKALLDRQLALLEREREAEVKQASLLTSNVAQRVLEKKGLAVGGLGVASISVGLGGKSMVELDRPSAYHTSPVMPPHTLRPGDLARIAAHVSDSASGALPKKAKKPSAKDASKDKGSASSEGVEGVVAKVSDTRIVIAVDTSRGAGEEELELPERCRIIKLANSATFDRMRKTLERLQRTLVPADMTSGDGGASEPPSALLQTIFGLSAPTHTPLKGEPTLFDESLNPSQRAAVRLALEMDQVALIHGPPGTGKSHTLVEIIRQFAAQGKRILVCGASNLAVDNLLERLVPHKLPVTRLGHPARILSALHTSTLEFQTAHSSADAVVKDVKDEIEQWMRDLRSGKVRGKERRVVWKEVKELRKEYRQREGGVVKGVVAQAQIVLATCHGAGGRQLWSQPDFDICIIDESTQALEAACWIPILRAKKLVLAGDPLQLPPTILSDTSRPNRKDKKSNPPTKSSAKSKLKAAPEKAKDKADTATPAEGDALSDADADPSTPALKAAAAPPTGPRPRLRPPRTLETTLFERLLHLYGEGLKALLTVQYRMHDLIQQFPSATLYSNLLTSHPSVSSRLLSDLPNVTASDDDGTLSAPLVFIDTEGCEYYERTEGEGQGGDEGSKLNENEAEAVVQHVGELMDAGVLASQIAVITPYQAQVALLSSLLHPANPEIEIGSVDGVQGREQEAVIISLVRSNEKGEVGFLKEERRLNVAMTRAKRHLVHSAFYLCPVPPTDPSLFSVSLAIREPSSEAAISSNDGWTSWRRRRKCECPEINRKRSQLHLWL